MSERADASDTSRYEFRVLLTRNGVRRSGIIVSHYGSDPDAVSAAHAIADAIDLCGGEDIEVGISALGERDIGLISDRAGGDLAFYERQHKLGADYQLD